MKRFIALICTLALIGSAFMLPVSTLARAEDSYTPMKYGDSGDNVVAVQEQLKALGYYTGKVSGNFMDGTRAAVKKFQADYDLKQTGIVDGETEALLMSAEYRELTTGDSGDDVLRLQEQLHTLGYYNGKLSSDYLEGTTAGIQSFQEKNSLPSTGTADVETQRALFSSAAIAKDAPEATPTPAPGSDLGDINDVVMAPDGDKSSASADVEYSKKLTRGSTGDQVKLVQQRLTDLGYFSGPISGNYMNKTVDAVKQFQTNNGLTADGVTGEETWNLMFDVQQALNASASPRPTPEPTPIPYAITVDVNNQATTVYGLDDSGNYTKVVRQMVCSTGMVATPSDVGIWELNGKKARWCFFSKYGSYAQYWTRINAYIAFHSVIYQQVDYNAMSTKSYNLLGSRASHGCIRLLNADAKWVYDNVGAGVKVTITEDLPDDPELHHALKPAPLIKGSKTPSTTPQPTATPAYSSTGTPPQPFRTLKKNSQGEDVYWLQMRLKELGYYNGAVTGTFLGGTQKAVKAFQRANGIYATGEANETTLTAVYAIAVATPTPTPTPQPTFTPTPAPTPTPSPTSTPTPVPTATAKTTSAPTATTKATSAPTATTKTTSTPTATTKATPAPTATAKVTSAPTATATATANATLASTATTKR